VKVLITTEGGFIGPFWWRNKSPVLNGQLASADGGWIDHYFTLHGSWGMSKNFVSCIKLRDVEIHQIKDGLDEIAISEIPKFFLDSIKISLIRALMITTYKIATSLQINHLNNCLNLECQPK
jgi:hypothetical protein